MNKILMILISFWCLSARAEWTHILDEDGISVYSGEISTDGIIPFKANGIVNASIKDVTKILKDYEKKNQWSPKLKSVKMHEILPEEKYIFSEYYKTPWPAADREFLLSGGIKYINQNQILFYAQSIKHNKKRDDHIQADVKFLNVELTSVAKDKTKIDFTFHGDMKGWMPVWLINLIQKKWPLRFIQGLRKQVKLID